MSRFYINMPPNAVSGTKRLKQKLYDKTKEPAISDRLNSFYANSLRRLLRFAALSAVTTSATFSATASATLAATA